MPTELITNTLVKSLVPRNKTYEVLDRDLKGLMLRVHPTGRIAYYCHFARGKRVMLGLHPAMTPTLARKTAKEVLGQHYSGVDPIEEKRLTKASTLGEFIDSVYKPWALGNLRTGHATINSLKTRFPDLQSKKLPEITGWDLEKWKTKRLKMVTPATVNRDLVNIRAAFNRAVDWGYIKVSPMKAVKKVKEAKEPKVRYLSPHEEQRLRKALADRDTERRTGRITGNKWRSKRGKLTFPEFKSYTDYFTPLILLLLNTGIRRGEAFSLQWRDINWVDKQLTVRGATAKSFKTRYIPLNDEAMQVLKEWHEQHDDSTGEALVFQSKYKNVDRLSDVRKVWAGILKKANIQDFRLHDTRHHFASRLVQNGVDLSLLRELLGHSNFAMTLVYSHLTPKNLADAVAKLCQ